MKKATKSRTSAKPAPSSSASKQIDDHLQGLADWRGRALTRVRALIRQADPEVVEEVKWRGVPVWSHDGHICTGEVYKQHVKLTFPKGAHLEDPAGLFNNGLEGNAWRAIDIREGEAPDEKAFKALIRTAIAFNVVARESKSMSTGAKASTAQPKGAGAKAKTNASQPKADGANTEASAPKPKKTGGKTKAPSAPPKSTGAKTKAASTKPKAASSKSKSGVGAPKPGSSKPKRSSSMKSKSPSPTGAPRLLSGENPQIAKGDGDAPVQAYIAAVPGWKQAVCRKLDALITRAVPGVQKAVKWNSPFYGVAGQGWFLSFHCITKYVKVGFFRGSSLQPLPPGESKQKDVRYLDIHEGDPLDEARFAAWVKQASQLPGERM